MCRVLKVQRSGFYAWLKVPLSARAREDARLVNRIRHFYHASQGSYGSPRIFTDLREDGETCGKHRVVRLMARAQATGVANVQVAALSLRQAGPAVTEHTGSAVHG